jgi:hypothetical protein
VKEEGSEAFVVVEQKGIGRTLLWAGRERISSAGSWVSLLSWRWQQLQLQVEVEKTATNWNVDRAAVGDSVDSGYLIVVAGTVGIVEKAGGEAVVGGMS